MIIRQLSKRALEAYRDPSGKIHMVKNITYGCMDYSDKDDAAAAALASIANEVAKAKELNILGNIILQVRLFPVVSVQDPQLEQDREWYQWRWRGAVVNTGEDIWTRVHYPDELEPNQLQPKEEIKMDNQHNLIKVYRDLSQDEIDLMNRIKEQGEQLDKLVEELQTRDLDQRWVSIGKTNLQQGVMALVRAVARPTTF